MKTAPLICVAALGLLAVPPASSFGDEVDVHGNLTWLYADDLGFGKFSSGAFDYQGMAFTYTDSLSGTSSLSFTATRPDSEWVFEHLETFNPSAWDETTTPVMKLDVNHVLTLYKKSDGSEVIQLDPDAGMITINGDAVLTVSGADAAYIRKDALTWATGTSTIIGSHATAFGSSTTDGDYATALGQSSATGDSAIAMGTSSASGTGSTAMGSGSQGIGDYTTALGSSYAGSNYATAMGLSTANGVGSTALGYYSSTDGDYATAMGYSTANGASATAMGQSGAYAAYSTALGNSQTADPYSTAMGYSIGAGQYSTAMGASLTWNNYATAMGNSTAAGRGSTTMGWKTQANSVAQVVVGQFNLIQWADNPEDWNLTDELFTVGNGTDESNRSNAFVILKNGDTTVNGKFTVTGTVHLDPQGDLDMGTFTTEPAP